MLKMITLSFVIRLLTKLVSLYFVFVLISIMIDIQLLIDTLNRLHNLEMLESMISDPLGVYSIIMVILSIVVIPLEILDFKKWKYSRLGYFVFNFLVVIGISYLLISAFVVINNNPYIKESIPNSVLLDRLWWHILLVSISLVICSLLWIEKHKHNNYNQALKGDADNYSASQ